MKIKMSTNFWAWAQTQLGLVRIVDETYALRKYAAQTLDRLEDVMLALSRPPAPFVCVLAEGEVETHRKLVKRKGKPVPLATVWKPATFGASGTVDRSRVFDIDTSRPMREVRIVVFTDLSRVDVQLFMGVDLVSQAVDACPLGYIADWQPGVRLRVSCHVRGAS